MLVDDRIAVEGAYPSRETLAALAGVVVQKLDGRRRPAPACCEPRAPAGRQSRRRAAAEGGAPWTSSNALRDTCSSRARAASARRRVACATAIALADARTARAARQHRSGLEPRRGARDARSAPTPTRGAERARALRAEHRSRRRPRTPTASAWSDRTAACCPTPRCAASRSSSPARAPSRSPPSTSSRSCSATRPRRRTSTTSSSTPRRPGTRCACSSCRRRGRASSRANVGGTSCLGPLAGLKAQQALYDASRARARRRRARRRSCWWRAPERVGARRGRAHARASSRALGVATSGAGPERRLPARTTRATRSPSRMEARGRAALDEMPAGLRALPRTELPLLPFGLVGHRRAARAVRRDARRGRPPARPIAPAPTMLSPPLAALVDRARSAAGTASS